MGLFKKDRGCDFYKSYKLAAGVISVTKMALWRVILLFLHARVAFSDNVGWKAFFTENIDEFHDIPLKWEEETPIPSYVTGTFVRNGAARISFGSKRRILASWLEGWAKIHSFKFNGSRVLFSGKMLETPLYKENVENGELTPQMTFNYFDNPEDEWSFWEKLQIIRKAAGGSGYDNSNPAVWRIGPANAEKGVYMAVTDDPLATRFDIDTLDTLGLQTPKLQLPMTASGCTHWMREPGTDNSAVLLLYPVTFDATKIWSVNFHLFETITHDPKGTTDIYLINLKTGDVTRRTTDYVYSLHHC